MFDIFEGNVISLTKGNSVTIDITPVDTSTEQPYILQEGDKVLFTVKDRRGETVIQKVLDDSSYSDPEDTSLNCELEPADTADLLTGEYKYDCLLLTSDGQAVTFIKSAFILSEAIGMYSDVH